MHGLAASGKSTVALALVQAFHALRARSDVERKRIAGLAPDASSASPVGAGLYSADRSEATYARLADLAAIMLGAGYPAVIDATFIRRSHRDRLARVAKAHGVRCVIVDVQAPPALLRERLVARAARGGDASEATGAVLDRQLEMSEPLAPEERGRCVAIDGRVGVTPAALEAIARKAGMRGRPSHA
jgi:predicted kinase